MGGRFILFYYFLAEAQQQVDEISEPVNCWRECQFNELTLAINHGK